MRLILLYFSLITFGAYAQPYAGDDKPAIINYPKSASCTPPITTTTMSYNNVECMVHTAGNLWQVPGQNYCLYEVPKNSGVMALFTSALWLGGTDANSQLKLAALRYREGQDYWTGPLAEGSAETNYENCLFYDQHFVTTADMVREFNKWFEAGVADALNGTSTQNELFPDYEVPDIIKNWPAHGDESQGQSHYLAPFFDYNEDGDYNWEDGDYPWYDLDKTKECTVDRSVSLYGDQNYWWIMNDKGNIHTETGAEPIGMEIRAQAFAFASNNQVNNMTFYNYELINRGSTTLYDTYFGCFTDGALGDPFDDYVGCDVNRGLGYYYNGDNFDGDNASFKGYGYNPPAVGVDFFEGPYQDDDGIDNAYGIGPDEALNGIGYGDGIVDNERFGMRRFLYYSNTTNGANPNQTDPINAPDYYNYLRGYWKDGSPFYYGGSGHISDSEADPNVPCDFMFPGDTDPLGWGTGGVPQASWTEWESNNVPNDRRFVQSAGPFVLKPGAVNNITVGVVWARASGGTPFESVETLRVADDKAQALFENCFRILEGPHAPDMTVQELENSVVLTLSNPITSNNFGEKYEEVDPFIAYADPNVDKKYRFQGYQIYQVVNDEIGVADLTDVTKARLVAQCDIEDGIGRLVNFDFSDAIGASIPMEMVDGEDEGIRHSFLITEDQFAQGDRRLINFKRYYYMAIAYAHNNYADFDPDDPAMLDGQKMPYLASRKASTGEVKVMECIPHNPMPEANGTGQLIEYGSTPIITRLDGYGNGGRTLELTQSSKNAIILNGKMDTPSYDYGAGPINVKVVDPLNVVGGYFELQFTDYNATNTNGADTADWVLYHFDKKDGNLLGTYNSEKSIEVGNEQIITDLGISVFIDQSSYYLPNGTGVNVDKSCKFLSASMTYADSSKRWLDGVHDNSTFSPLNWIRSGIYDPTSPDDCLPAAPDYFNPCNYPDELGVDPNKKFDKILGGIIAPHKLTGYQSSYMPIAYIPNFSPITSRLRSSLSFLPSVDIVITNDQSKWTRCPVIEMGRDATLNEGGAEPGELRATTSVNKDGDPEGSTQGMGWFPGYAIDVESGARLYMAFGENSFLAADNGKDMIWNPSDRLVANDGTFVLGGGQPVYIFSYKSAEINGQSTSGYANFDEYNPNLAESDATNDLYVRFNSIMNGGTSQEKQLLYSGITWIFNPVTVEGHTAMESDVEIKIRVTKEYKDYNASGDASESPRYSWNMDEVATELGRDARLVDALDLINIVPNPYGAYSEYELNRLDSRVKITNLPERCEIKIYSSNGKMIKKFSKDSPQTFYDWLLINEKGIPIASGVYLVHVEVPGIGERIIKAFIAMRVQDLQNL